MITSKDKRNIILIISLIATLVCLIFIFSNSLKNSEQSTEQSSFVYKLVNSVTEYLGFNVSHTFVRKLAHVTEFALLGIFTAFVSSIIFKFSRRDTKLKIVKKLIPAAILCIAAAAFDELLQFSSEGRAPQISDALLDVFGSLIGISVVWAILIIFAAVHNKRKQKASL